MSSKSDKNDAAVQSLLRSSYTGPSFTVTHDTSEKPVEAVPPPAASPEERFATISKKKDLANDALQRGSTEEAIGHYNDCLAELQKLHYGGPLSSELDKQIGELFLKIENNLSLCYIKIKDFEKAVTYLDRVLQYDPYNFKAYSRKILIYEERGDIENAFETVTVTIMRMKEKGQYFTDVIEKYEKLKPQYEEERKKRKEQQKELFSKMMNSSEKKGPKPEENLGSSQTTGEGSKTEVPPSTIKSSAARFPKAIMSKAKYLVPSCLFAYFFTKYGLQPSSQAKGVVCSAMVAAEMFSLLASESFAIKALSGALFIASAGLFSRMLPNKA
jgi:tetratricopeptide (TPR) repeat protein